MVEGGVLAGEAIGSQQPPPHDRLPLGGRCLLCTLPLRGGGVQAVVAEEGAVGRPVRRPAGVGLGGAVAGGQPAPLP